MGGKKWTENEIDLLCKHYPISDREAILCLISRSWSSINHKAERLNILRDRTWTTEEESNLRKNYAQTPRRDLQALLPNRSWSSIKNKAFLLGLIREIVERPSPVWGDKKIGILKTNYATKSREELEQSLGLPWSAIESMSNKLGLYREGRSKPLRSPVVMDFTEIDTQEKAYILGVLFADGSIQYKKKKYCVKLSWQEKDLTTLEKIRDIITPRRNLYFVKLDNNPNWNNQYTLSITNKKLCDQLLKHGVFPNKTYTLKRPILDYDLIPHFIRGYFDGDGSVTEKKKDIISPTIGNLKVCVTGTKDMIDFIDSHFRNTFSISYCYICQSYASKHAYNLWLSGKKARLFLKMIYQGSTIHLGRKYKIAKKYMDMTHDYYGRPLD